MIIGTFILFFGWFGFNIGGSDTIGLNAVNTLLAGATGAVVALYIKLVQTGKADILMACNGALAGLVGITAPCAYVDTWAAVVIGGIAAPIMMLSLQFLEKVLKVDDPWEPSQSTASLGCGDFWRWAYSPRATMA